MCYNKSIAVDCVLMSEAVKVKIMNFDHKAGMKVHFYAYLLLMS